MTQAIQNGLTGGRQIQQQLMLFPWNLIDFGYVLAAESVQE
jgi:hypothetical protein